MRRTIFFLLLACVFISFFGCANTASETDHQPKVLQVQESVNKKTETAYLLELSERNSIRVAYPILLSAEADSVNASIYDFVCQEVDRRCFGECELVDAREIPAGFPTDKELYEGDYSNYALCLDYSVTSLTDDVISVAFDGMINLKSSAHPTHLFFAVNIDPKNNTLIRFDDRYVIDDALYDTFAEYAQKDLMELGHSDVWPEGWGTFSDMFCSKETFLNIMTSTNVFYFYFTKEGVGISYPVAHSMGDHIEVVLPYSELKEFSKQGE